MMHTRRVLGVAAAAATVTGLLLPTQAAFAVTTCTFTPSGTTESLDGNCLLSETHVVPDGWTLDGNGFTITADPAGTFARGVIASESGTGATTPKAMNVKHLTIATVPNGTDGILFDGAQGAVSRVTVQGGQNGVEADNDIGAGIGTGLTAPQVKVGRTTIGNYQDAGVYAHGDLKLDVLQADILSPQASTGHIVAGVYIQSGAHGSVKDSHIRLSDVELASPTAFGAGVQIEKDDSLLPRRIEVKRNVFTGGNADFGISVSNAFPTKKLTADTNCNLFVRHDTSADDPYGVGVARWEDSSKTNLLVSNSTFQGNWKHNTRTVGTTTGPPNTLGASTSTCPPGSPTHLRAIRKAHKPRKATVSWHTAAAPDYAPLTGYRVKAKAKGHAAIIKNVGPGHTSVVLKGLRMKLAYHVTVTARSNGGKASAAARLPRA
jgi:Fibronectin type III domain